MNRVGIDAHKKSCTTSIFADGSGVEASPIESFVFKTTPHGISEFMQKVPCNSLIVIEASTTGKALTRSLGKKYKNIHMVSPPEKKPQVKTDKRDSERIVREDMLGYLRRCYIPSQYIEDMRSLVTQQIDLGEKIARVKCSIDYLPCDLVQNVVDFPFRVFDLKLERGSEFRELLTNKFIWLLASLTETCLSV